MEADPEGFKLTRPETKTWGHLAERKQRCLVTAYCKQLEQVKLLKTVMTTAGMRTGWILLGGQEGRKVSKCQMGHFQARGLCLMLLMSAGAS